MPVLHEYTYIFAIGTFFALLEAYNNGANDVANAWATSVSSRSVTYRQAMFLCLIFELTGALAVGARTASTIKNGIIPLSAFQGNAPVQLLAFTCAAAGASIWVMWCTRHNAHVSSTYSLVSSIAGVGVATVGVKGVQWGWNNGSGLGAIFAGLVMAPFISAVFGATIFMLVKTTVHMRVNPVPWAVYTSPFFFLIAGTVCTLSIVYKGSPKLGLSKKPGYWIAGVSVGSGMALALLAALFFVPYVNQRVIRKDYTLKWYHVFLGPLLFSRQAPADAEFAMVPNYAVMDHDDHSDVKAKTSAPPSIEMTGKGGDSEVTTGELRRRSIHVTDEGMSSTASSPEIIPQRRNSITNENPRQAYARMLKEARDQHHADLRQERGPIGWAMRTLHENQLGAGSIYELHNMKAVLKCIPAGIVVCLMYGLYYDIHKAQLGVLGTPEGKRMARVYAHAPRYANEVEYLYSFVQVITACTASFAHGANDVGNAVGVWAAMYAAWSTGSSIKAKEAVPTWQIAVMALTICFGFITYGYNIMKVMGNKITYHSPSRGSSMELGAAITILIFSQYKLPVSTSMCITGATVGVGLCNGSFKAVNWSRVGLLLFSWIMTIPIAGLIGGLLMGITLNTPSF
ncbi:phosphate-repressible phosphate permease [Aureobasidium sp. EXF-12298]|nr:phosphate-repressible phosphate permease [Aureobasidium sp. EXF-12298]KAI4753927.1 phosphate-repressible phosphate permease [Aureobasidium sp. EXF-12344]KAI4781143.1 phosphate-repressible phosphate permease [Aureobasidium sp. EXF-3400]